MSEWRTVPSYPAYEVSADGDVRHKGHVCPKGPGAFKKAGEAIAQRDMRGYSRVTLHQSGKQITRNVHILVAEAFLGPRPAGMDILHGDGDRKNNALSNLRYGTRKENETDKDKHGRRMLGERHANAKLTEEQVRVILIDITRTYAALGEAYGVSPKTIEAIKARRVWRHVDAPAAKLGSGHRSLRSLDAPSEREMGRA